jgi:hypothetical protein
MALTDTEIKRAKTKGKAYGIRDGGGLYLWITPPGWKIVALEVQVSGQGKTHVLRQVSRRQSSHRQEPPP